MEALIWIAALASVIGFALAVHLYVLLVATLQQVKRTQHAVHMKIEHDRLREQQRSVGGTY